MNIEFQLILLILGSIISFAFGIIYRNLKVEKPNNDNSLDRMCKDIEWLKEVHDHRDANGMPLWYVPRELQQLCSNTASAMTLMNHNLNEIKEILSHNTKIMEDFLRIN